MDNSIPVKCLDCENVTSGLRCNSCAQKHRWAVSKVNKGILNTGETPTDRIEFERYKQSMGI